ncbi:MAG: hypothetical protein VB959_17315 [Rhodospirillales bacterium]|jgi:hypothetical protein
MIQVFVVGHHQEGDVEPALTHRLQQVQSVEFRHVPIGNHQLAIETRIQCGQRLGAAGGQGNPGNAESTERRPRHIHRQGIILHQEHPRGRQING